MYKTNSSEEVVMDDDEHQDTTTEAMAITTTTIMYPYMEQIHSMVRRQLHFRKSNSTNQHNTDVTNDQHQQQPISIFGQTMIIDYTNIMSHDMELAEAIVSDYNRFDPFLRNAIMDIIQDMHPELYNHHH